MKIDISLSEEDIRILAMIKGAPEEKLPMDMLYSESPDNEYRIGWLMSKSLLAPCDWVSVGKDEAGNDLHKPNSVFITPEGKDALSEYVRLNKRERSNKRHDFVLVLVSTAAAAFFSNLDRLIRWIGTW